MDPGYNCILQLTQVPCLDGIQAASGNLVPSPCDPNNPTIIPNPIFEVLSVEELTSRLISFDVGEGNELMIIDESLTPIVTPLLSLIHI